MVEALYESQGRIDPRKRTFLSRTIPRHLLEPALAAARMHLHQPFEFRLRKDTDLPFLKKESGPAESTLGKSTEPISETDSNKTYAERYCRSSRDQCTLKYLLQIIESEWPMSGGASCVPIHNRLYTYDKLNEEIRQTLQRGARMKT